MKLIQKCLAILLTTVILCAGAISLTVSAASLQDSGVLLVIERSGGKTIATGSVQFNYGGKKLLISPAIEGEEFYFQSVNPMFSTRGSVNFLGSDSNNVINFYEMTGSVSDIPVLEMGSIDNASELLLLYYDSSSQIFEVAEVGISAAQSGLIILNGVPSTAMNGVLVDGGNNSFVGYMIGTGEQGSIAVSSDYIQGQLGGSGSTSDQPTSGQQPEQQDPQQQPEQQDSQQQPEQQEPQQQPEQQEPQQQPEQQEPQQQPEVQEPAQSAQTSPKFLTILILVVVGGLIFLVIRSKSRGGDSVPVLNGAEQQIMPAGDVAGRMCIRAEGGRFDGRKFEIEGSVTIGRQAGRCNICYPEDTKGISGLHCQLRSTGNQVELIDLGSSYGTFVNGTKINPNVPVMLNVGDRFWLASPTNTFVVYR